MNEETPSIKVIFGSAGTGKSTTIKYMLLRHLEQKKFDFVTVYTGPSTIADGDYDYIQPSKYIVTSDHDTVLAEQIRKLNGTNYKGVIIFEDVTGKILFKSGLYDQLFTNYRHIGGGISVWVIIHYVKKLPPIVRECATESLMFKQTSLPSLKGLWEAYGQEDYPTYKAFAAFFQKETGKPFHFLYWRKNPPQGESRYSSFVVPYPLPDTTILIENPKEEKKDGERQEEPQDQMESVQQEQEQPPRIPTQQPQQFQQPLNFFPATKFDRDNSKWFVNGEFAPFADISKFQL